MSARIIIALVHGQDLQRNALASFRQIERAVQHCNLNVRNLSNNPLPDAELAEGNAFHGIVVAPEYLFVSSANPRAPMTEAEKDEIVARLFRLSRDYPKILIIPGTLFYRKGLERPDTHARRLITKGAEAGQRTGGPKNGNRRESFANKIQAAIDAVPLSNNRELTKFIGTGMEDGPLQWSPSMNAKLEHIKAKTAEGVCRNRTYVFLGGELLAKYDKCFDHFESGAPKSFVFLQGRADQSAAAGGFTFGIEVCRDHASGLLKSRGVEFDFHVVLSDYTDTERDHMAVRPMGYFVHASTRTDNSSLWRRGRTVWINMTEERRMVLSKTMFLDHGSLTVTFYEVDLPPAASASPAAAAAAAVVPSSGKGKERIDKP